MILFLIMSCCIVAFTTTLPTRELQEVLSGGTTFVFPFFFHFSFILLLLFMFAQIVLRPGQGTRQKDSQSVRRTWVSKLRSVSRLMDGCRGIMDDGCHDEKREKKSERERDSIIRQ